MPRSARSLAPAGLLALTTLIACGGGGSGTPGRGPGTPPTAAATPTPTDTLGPQPTAMPTSGIVPTAACNEIAEPLPGTYTTIATFGTVSGSTYAQNPGNASGGWAAIAYATPTPVPSPVATVTALPTATPSTSPQTYVEYAGVYDLPGFNGLNGNGPFQTLTTRGCFLLVATQSGSPVIPGDPYNSYAVGFPGFVSSNGVTTTPVASGNIVQFDLTNLTPSSGSGTFRLDNNETGTVTVTSSAVVTFSHARAVRDHATLLRRRL